MKTRRVVIYLAIWLGATFGLAAAAESQAPAEGAPLPEFTLPAPKDAAHGAYLGVSGKKEFTVADIKAEVAAEQHGDE